MIAVDTNILVYSHRPDCRQHEAAKTLVRRLAAGPKLWGVPQHCLIEFAGVVTNPRIWTQPTANEECVLQVNAWRGSPSLSVLEEGADFWDAFAEVLKLSKVRGGAVHDARIAACCRQHGVTELLTCDRDFSRFPFLHCRNPLS
jgi:toxin-antitoxin system PIN domain toxin